MLGPSYKVLQRMIADLIVKISGGSSIHRFAVADRFPNRQPDVGYTESADEAPNEAIHQKFLDSGKVHEQGIIRPEQSPWRNRENDADLEAEQDEHDQKDAASPKLPFSWLPANRRQHQDGAVGLRQIAVLRALKRTHDVSVLRRVHLR
jgi:hypothetical protein